MITNTKKGCISTTFLTNQNKTIMKTLTNSILKSSLPKFQWDAFALNPTHCQSGRSHDTGIG